MTDNRHHLEPLNPRFPILELHADAEFCRVLERLEMAGVWPEASYRLLDWGPDCRWAACRSRLRRVGSLVGCRTGRSHRSRGLLLVTGRAGVCLDAADPVGKASYFGESQEAPSGVSSWRLGTLHDLLRCLLPDRMAGR